MKTVIVSVMLLCSVSAMANESGFTFWERYNYVTGAYAEKDTRAVPDDFEEHVTKLLEVLDEGSVALEEHEYDEVMPKLMACAEYCDQFAPVSDELLVRKKLKKVACLLVQQRLVANNLRVCNDAVFKNIILKEDPIHGTNDITIVAPDSVPADYMLTLPATAGDAGQVLSTDGSGLLSWITTVTNASQLQLLFTATSNNIPNTLVLRDHLGSFSAQDISAEGNFLLPATTADAGQLKIDNAHVVHAFGLDNIFVGSGAGNFTLTGNANTAVGTEALSQLTTGTQNTALGASALSANLTGNGNVAVGGSTLNANTTGNNNVAVGQGALLLNEVNNNVAVGSGAMANNTRGINNVAVGESALNANTTGNNNTAVGISTLRANTTGVHNVAIGTNAMFANITGVSNVAIGSGALTANTTGFNNIAVGHGALRDNTTSGNIAAGRNALLVNTTGADNIAIGSFALDANTIGNQNIAIGSNALGANTTGRINVAVGTSALVANTIGQENTAVGTNALAANTTGNNNTAVGRFALAANTTGASNTAVGYRALDVNTIGVTNTAVGINALGANTTGSDNVAVGSGALLFNTTGRQSVAIGTGAGNAVTSADDVICIGFNVGGANTTGTCFIGNITGVNVVGAPVIVDANNQVGVTVSSIRYKTDIQGMGDATDNLMNLRPVQFRYKDKPSDSKLEYGLIAEEVNEYYPDIVVRNNDGEIETIQYQYLPVMTLNELQKLVQRVNELEAGQAAMMQTMSQLQN